MLFVRSFQFNFFGGGFGDWDLNLFSGVIGGIVFLLQYYYLASPPMFCTKQYS